MKGPAARTRLTPFALKTNKVYN